MTDPRVAALARRLVAVEGRSLSLPSLAFSSIDNGTLRATDDGYGETMQIGRQWDGTYAPGVTNGPIPPTPYGIAVVDGTESITVLWDGSWVLAQVTPMDWLRVDIHVGATAGFTPTHDNRVGTIAAPTGGAITVGLPAGTYYVKLVSWTLAGKVSLPSDPIEGDAWPIVVTSDGFAPAVSPDAVAIGGFDVVYTRWTAITNADPVWYDIHISLVSGFTPDSTTLVGSTQGTAFTIKQLPGAAPLPGDPDERKLQYFTDYFVKIVARDDDGSAAAGAESGDKIYQMTGVNLSADSVTAANVVAGTLTGDLFSASIILGSEIWTATVGQRVGMTPLGFFAYKPDGSIMLKIPTDGTDAIYDGELIVRGATILGGMSIQSSQNELTADAALTLMRGIVSPTASPQIADYYDTVTPSSAGLTTAQKTNNDPDWGLGFLEFNASEVSCIEWRSVWGGGCFSVFQQRPNGTREWYFNTAGVPIAPAGAYFSDFKGWEVWSATEMLSSPTPGQNGHYTLLRLIGNNNWYVWAPTGIYQYTRQNTLAPPVMGNNGTNIFVAEVINTNHLNIRYYVPGSGGGAMPAPTVAYESTTGYQVGTSLAAMVYHPTGFDLGTTARYITAERNNGSNVKMIYTSGTNANSIFPHASSNNWASVNKEAGSFESPTTARRGCAWDGTQFWTLSADGKLYKHTGDYWDPAVTSSTLWARLTFKDTDVAGTGVHETMPGTAKGFSHKRRSKWQWVAPAVPDNGGVDDPDRVVLYAARGVIPGNGQPANGAMWKQTEVVAYTTTTYTTLTTSGTNPPITNTFPAANAAKITNDNAELLIDGTGLGRFRQLFIGTDELLANPPYWNGYLSAGSPMAAWAGAAQTITAWVADGSPNSSGITVASGVWTIARPGRYRVVCKLWWSGVAGATGVRTIQARRVTPSVITIDSSTVLASVSTAYPAINYINRTYRFAAGETMDIRVTHTDTVNRAPASTSPDISYVQIEYVGP